MTQLIEYIRGTPKRRKLGILLAKPSGTNFVVGYSLCAKSDRFNREFGTTLAEKRADKFEAKSPFVDKADLHETAEYSIFECADKSLVACRHKIPETVMRALPAFMARCKAYYKDLDAPYWYQLITV